MVSEDSKFHNFANSLFFFCWLKLGLVFWTRLGDPSVRQSPKGVYVCPFLGQMPFVWSTFNFLHISQWITLPSYSSLGLYSFCNNLLHSLIMQLMVSSLSSHRLHLLFCCVLSILPLILLVFMALFCAAIKRDSISLLKFPFLSQVHILSREMLFISHLKRP